MRMTPKQIDAACDAIADAAALIRAQAERVLVLEEALRQIQDWPMHGNLTDNEDNVCIEDMPHYVAGRAYAVIALIQNYARNSIARAAIARATGAPQ